MDLLKAKKFSFKVDGLDDNTFGVVRFKGFEALSEPYEFEITLVSENFDIDFDSVMQNRAKLIIHREIGGDAVYNGIIAEFEQMYSIENVAFYRVKLVPKLWWISITHHNQVFLNEKIPDILKKLLLDAGLSQEDFEFRLMGNYEQKEFICQYDESHLNFFSRWLEREGMYYYFEQTNREEKIVISDRNLSHADLPQGAELIFSPPSGLESTHMSEIISRFICKHKLLPNKIILKDYNYEKPDLEIKAEVEVDPKGRGEVYYYYGGVKNPDECERLAKIISESLKCQKEEFYGESFIPYLMPGYTFTLKGHYRNSFNQKYFITKVKHEGDQRGYLLSGLSKEEKAEVFYRNSFVAIPASIQFRKELKTPKPKITGSIHAFIDASGSGEYAELDKQGRYKIILPFDLSGRKDGKASTWIRMSTPYGGKGRGMHFPIPKGTEVLVTFLNGDPDSPVISGVLFNPDNPNPVTEDNHTQCVIQTGSQNRIAIEDKKGSERILLHVPNHNCYIRLGAPNDPDDESTFDKIKDTTGEITDTIGEIGAKIFVEDWELVCQGLKKEYGYGESLEFYGGNVTEVFGGAKETVDIGYEFLLNLTGKLFCSLEATLGFENNKVVCNLREVEASENKVSAVQNELKAVQDKLQVIETEMKAMGESVKTAASFLKLAGDNFEIAGEEIEATGENNEIAATAMFVAGADLKLAAEYIETAGQKAKNIGMSIANAGINVINAGLTAIQ